MFEIAARQKIRWFHRGQLSTEDLWDLPVKELDGIFKALRREENSRKEESLLDEQTQEDEILSVKIAIVRHIVEVRLAEMEALKNAAARTLQKQKLLGILAEKQDADLRGKSAEEIEKMIEEL